MLPPSAHSGTSPPSLRHSSSQNARFHSLPSQGRRLDPSSDLIFNLIASITSIALPDISEEPLAAVPDPVSRGPAYTSTYRGESRRQNLKSPPASARTSLSYRPPSSLYIPLNEEEIDDDNAAEAPVIPTSRAVSLRSRQSSYKSDQAGSPAPRTYSLNSLSLSALRAKKQERSSSFRNFSNQAQAEETIPMRTSSLETTRSARQQFGVSRAMSPKGKERESITLLVRSRPPSQTRDGEVIVEEPVTQIRAPSHLQAVFEPAGQMKSPDSGPSTTKWRSPSLEHYTPLKSSSNKENEPESPSLEDDLKSVPERMSSLRQQNLNIALLRAKLRSTSHRNSIAENEVQVAVPQPVLKDIANNDDNDEEDEDGDDELYTSRRMQELISAKQGPRRPRSRESTRSHKAYKVLGISPTRSVATIRRGSNTTLTKSHLNELDSTQRNGSLRGTDSATAPPAMLPQYSRPAVSVDSSSSRTSISVVSERPAVNSAFRSRTPSVSQASILSRSDPHLQRWSTPPSVMRARERPSISQRQSMQSPRRSDARRDSVNSIEESVKAILQNPRLSRKIWRSLENRGISYSDVGDPKGHVVFCCVGMGVTRYVSIFHDELAKSLGLRIITPDRPGIGGSEPYAEGSRSPISWPDDIQTICQELNIHRFSLVAHSAGAIYALATALRMPQNIHGKIHLLAPWIPPSQLSSRRLPFSNSAPVGVLPRSQRFLRILPPSFLRLSNSRYLNPAVEVPKPPRRSYSRPVPSTPSRFSTSSPRAEVFIDVDRPSIDAAFSRPSDVVSIISQSISADLREPSPTILDQQHHNTHAYNTYLGTSIWAAATTNANPSVSLLICLEREHSIGFRYADVTAPVVIHHGTEDSRVPFENVRAVARDMKKVEFRIRKGEGHGLMGNAKIMAEVLTELAEAWKGRG